MGNFAVTVVEAAPPGRPALVELARDQARRERSFGEVVRAVHALAAHLCTGAACGAATSS